MSHACSSITESTTPRRHAAEQVRSGVATVATPDRPLHLERGGVLRHAHLAFEVFGSATARQTVLVCHALTGDAHVTRHDHTDQHERPGWWETLVGPGRAVDTATTRVICTNVLGGCAGSTGPASIDPDTGRRYGPDFPEITIADIVHAQRRFIAQLRLPAPPSVIGGSIGGLQVLEWLRVAPHSIDSAAVIAAGPALNAFGIAHNHAARNAIRADRRFHEGRYAPDQPPVGGLAAARQLAHLTYRTSDAFERRFGRRADADRFAVQSYLDYKGDSFVQRFDANAYLTLLDAMDRFDAAADGTLAASLRAFEGSLLIAGFTTDHLFPPSQSEQLAELARQAGARCDLRVIDSDEGHDAFLMPSAELETAVRSLLTKEHAP
ncbi:MAG: homoserine O-acetyltransferase MetX [Phycisphaerales bacterium]